MRFGTWNGLNRFDGYTFSVFKQNTQNSQSISNNFIDALCEDKFGNIWGGTNNGAIEAPFIIRGTYYYLFVSFDYCCRGINSNYKIMVGRSPKIAGPYVDKNGMPMGLGGRTLVLQGNEQYHGLGQDAVCNFNDKDYIIFHAYDSKDGGKPKLLIRDLRRNTDE